MFRLQIFVWVQTFRRVPPLLPCNFCHPATCYNILQWYMAWMMLITTVMIVIMVKICQNRYSWLNHNPNDHLLPKECIDVTRVYVIHFICLCSGVVMIIIKKLIGLLLTSYFLCSVYIQAPLVIKSCSAPCRWIAVQQLWVSVRIQNRYMWLNHWRPPVSQTHTIHALDCKG